MHMSSMSFRKKHCKAVSDIGILCFHFVFVVKKKRGEKGKKEKEDDARYH